VLRVRVGGGTPAIARASDIARQMFGRNDNFKVVDQRPQNDSAHNAINVVTAAIWIFALVAALAGLFTIAIVVFREIGRTRPVQPTLRSIGLTRADRAAAMVPRAVVIGAAGSVVAVLGAIALSPLLPFGIARRAEPHPGVHADWFVLLLGALFVLVFVAGVGLAAAIRSARAEAPRDVRPRRSLADLVGIARVRPAIATGVRMAVDPGRDDRAVPVRSAAVGAALGVLGVTAVLVFSASFEHVANTPRLYGWTWDVKARDPSDPAQCDRNTFGMDRLHGVSDVAAICYREVDLEKRRLFLWSFTPIRGAIGPQIVSGRAPATDDEVALGRDTLVALHKHIGDHVGIDAGQGGQDYRVVGQVLLPQLTYGDVQPLADGAITTQAGFLRTRPPQDDATTRYLVMRTAPGSTAGQLARTVRAQPAYNQDGPSPNPDTITTTVRPAEIERIRNTSWLLPALGLLMAILALTGLAHALVNAVRRRARDLAILKALGFAPRQVRATVAWQASTLAIVGLVFGLPLGVIVGRLTWSTIARNTGLGTGVTIPALALTLIVPAALLLVNAVAYFPARAAARMRAGTALATE
jgi:ABC-type lipoprotein release transport system permease subunit